MSAEKVYIHAYIALASISILIVPLVKMSASVFGN